MTDQFSLDYFLKLSQTAIDTHYDFFSPCEVTGDTVRFEEIFINHYRNFSSFLTIIDAFKMHRTADIDTLSRSMFESVITMGLLAKRLIDDDTERYYNFQFVEHYKNHVHLEKLGLSHLSGITSSEYKLVTKKRNEYFAKWGKNTPTWTGNNLLENVKLIDRSYTSTCNENRFYEYMYCQVYRHGSQTVHSSYAGIAHLLTNEEDSDTWKPDIAHLLFSSFHSLLVFSSSIRFMGRFLQKTEAEEFYNKIADDIISGYEKDFKK